jgi:hypothetical protein
MMQALTRLLLSVAVLAAASAVAAAQTAGDPDAERKADLVTAYKILVNEGILDSFGHVSVRSSKDPNVFYMPRAIHAHSQAVIPLTLASIKLKPVIAQAGFLPPETPTFESRDARKPGGRGMQVTDSARGAALARTLSSHPAALMRGHGEVVVGASVKQAVVYAAYIDINARMQTQALLLSHNIVLMDESELFTPAEFDINRPWEHLRQKTLDDAAKAKVDRAQFGLDQTQIKQ